MDFSKQESVQDEIGFGGSQQIQPSLFFPLKDQTSSTGQATYESWAFRLIRLSAGSRRHDLNCRLITSTLGQEKGKYAALSYQWGSKTKSEHILLNGHRHSVPSNLVNALRDIRLDREGVDIWVDALCINQDHVQEKSTQVQRMAHIYSLASRTIAYLGPTSHFTSIAIAFIEELDLVANNSEKLNDILNNKDYAPRWAALGTILTNSYWTRIWIVQEIAVASHVILQIGGQRIELEVFRRVVLKLVDRYINNILENCHGVAQLQLNAVWAVLEARRRYQTKSKPKLDELLVLFLSSAATEPKDKVYGVYSMCVEAWQNQLPPPDYRLSLPMVYVAAVRAIIQNSKNLDILSALNCSSGSLLPSWCPNFAGASPPCLPSMEADWQCAGSRQLEMTFADNQDNQIMRLKGFVFDNVNKVILVDNLHLHQTEAEAWVGMKPVQKAISQSPYGDETQYGKALLDTWTLESPPKVTSKGRAALGNTSYAHSGGLEEEPDIYRTWFIRRLLEEGPRPWGNGHSQRKHQNFARHRNIALTNRGYLCLLPETAAEGDAIMVLYGARVPFCVRRAEYYYGSDGRAWKFLGDCYVHGIMKGEAMEMVDAQPDRERDFTFI